MENDNQIVEDPGDDLFAAMGMEQPDAPDQEDFFKDQDEVPNRQNSRGSRQPSNMQVAMGVNEDLGN